MRRSGGFGVTGQGSMTKITVEFLLNIMNQESIHFKVDAHRNGLDVFTDTAYPVCRG